MKHTTRGVVKWHSSGVVFGGLEIGWVEIIPDDRPPDGAEVEITWRTKPRRFTASDMEYGFENVYKHRRWLDPAEFLPPYCERVWMRWDDNIYMGFLNSYDEWYLDDADVKKAVGKVPDGWLPIIKPPRE
jgi:hypothetical protein